MPGYWDYPTQSDTEPNSEAPPGTDLVNGSGNHIGTGHAVGGPYYSTDVGAYTFKPSDSAYGTFDQGGNIYEWTETLISGAQRSVRGGSWNDTATIMHASFRYPTGPPSTYENEIYGFRVASSCWVEKVKLLASDGIAEDWFGRSVSVCCDYIIVGAHLKDADGLSDSGAAYIFKRDGENWVEQCELTTLDGAANDNFGYSVSVNGDYAIVGAYLDDDNGNSSGSAYIYIRKVRY